MTHQFGRTRVRALAATTGMVALIGCGSEAAPTKEATPAATRVAAAVVPDELVGTWTTKLAPSTASYLEGGKYTMKLAADGSVDMYYPGGKTAESCLTQKTCQSDTVKASGGTLTIVETEDCSAPANYSYKISGTTLTTARVKETCGGDRPRLFDGTTWRSVAR